MPQVNASAAFLHNSQQRAAAAAPKRGCPLRGVPWEKLPAKANGVALSLFAAEPSGRFGAVFYPSCKSKGWAATRLAGARTGSPDPLSPPPAGSWGGPGGPVLLAPTENAELLERSGVPVPAFQLAPEQVSVRGTEGSTLALF